MQTTHPAPGGQLTQLNSLTGLRFVSAFLVFLAHTAGFLLAISLAPTQDHYSKFIFSSANGGVTFFFILSGFILTWVAKQGESKRAFWRRRFWKIYPNHFVTFIATGILMGVAGIALTWKNTVPTLFLVQTWIPSFEFSHYNGGNTPTWTLGVEALFYFLFPWLLILGRKIKASRLWLAIGVVTLVIIAIPVIAQTLLPREPIMMYDPIPWWHYWFVTHFPLTRLFEFALGILFALVVMNGRWIRMPLTAALGLVVVSMAAAAYIPDEFDQVAPMALPIGLAIAAAGAADMNGRSTIFSNRVMVFLGEISFAFYIIHFLVVSYGPMGVVYPTFFTTKWTLSNSVGLSALSFAVTFVLAVLLHRYVEMPCMKYFSRPRARKPITELAPINAPISPAGPAADKETIPAGLRN